MTICKEVFVAAIIDGEDAHSLIIYNNVCIYLGKPGNHFLLSKVQV